MKRIFLVASFLILSVCSFAQKSYLQVISEYTPSFASNYEKTDIFLIGDIPSGMNAKYNNAKIDEILTQLIEKGYTLDFVTGFSNTRTALIGNDKIVGSIFYVFSKPTGTPSAVRSVDIDNDEEITEMARYNLQGVPVKESDKGVQIIVYSNYTTKIIVNK